MEETGRTHDVLVAGKRLRDGRREITTVLSKSVGLLVNLAPLKTGHLADTRCLPLLKMLLLQDEAIRKYFEAAGL